MAPINRHARSRLRMLHAQRVTGQPETSRPSLRSGLTAYVVISPGSDALLPPSPCGWLMRGPGWATSIAAGLDAQTPGVRTTRLPRPRTSSLGPPRLACAHRRDHAKTLSAPCRIAPIAAHGFPPCNHHRADAVAATAFHPAFRAIAIRPLVELNRTGT